MLHLNANQHRLLINQDLLMLLRRMTYAGELLSTMLHLNVYVHRLLFNQDLLMLLRRMGCTGESDTLQDPGLTLSIVAIEKTKENKRESLRFSAIIMRAS